MIEAEIAKDEALKFEAKLDRLSRNQDGTIKLTLTVHPQEFPAQLMTDPLGQRYMAVLVAINHDETPVIRPKEKPIGQRAKALAALPEFQTFVGEQSAEHAIEYIRRCCDVTSCADIESDDIARNIFLEIESMFREWSKEKARGRL